MKRYKKSMYMACLAIGCMAPNLQAYQPSSSWSPQAVVGTMIGVGAITYGIYKIVSWLFPSNEQKMQQAEAALRIAEQAYNPMFGVVYNYKQYCQERPYREETLHFIVQQLYRWYGDSTTYHCSPSSITQEITKLKKIHAGLAKSARSSRAYGLKDDMEFLAQRIQGMVSQLTILLEFFTQHESFFVCMGAYHAMVNCYGSLVSQETSSTHSVLTPDMRLVIMSIGNSQTYPYSTLAARLQRDVEKLRSSLTPAVYADYPTTGASVKMLYAAAHHLQAMIMSDAAYTEEVRHKALMELEQQRIDLLNKQVQAQRDLVYAQERQARALEDQARQAAARKDTVVVITS